MTDIETVVVGAGVVGLATAAALATSGHDVMVLEREASIGQGISARNSEVIHAGIYYPNDSLKARLCVRGKELLYKYSEARHIPHSRIGKLIVATTDEEITALEALQQKATYNGVDDITMLSATDTIAMQPGLHCVAALHSPSTGIIDSHSFMINLQADIEHHNGMVVCNTGVQSIRVVAGNLQVKVDDGTTISAKNVVNCSGLNAVALAKTIDTINPTSIPRALFAKGNYFKLAAKAPFNKLIYPAPVVGGLGVHLTIDLAGQKRFGPDVEWLDTGVQDEPSFDYQVNPQRADSFYSAIRKYWPDLPDNSLVPDYSGIRPKITHDHSSDLTQKKPNNIDFEFSTKQHHGIEGLVNMYGIESPGLTSSLAIAELISHTLK